jgi:hypothetical protein
MEHTGAGLTCTPQAGKPAQIILFTQDLTDLKERVCKALITPEDVEESSADSC